MTSASAIASRACSWTRASIGSSGSTSRPPVSTTTNRRPFHSASPYRRSRVVRARSSTIAVRDADDPVEQRALADVRTADDGDDRERAAERASTARRPWPGGHGQAAPVVGRAVTFGQRGRAAGRRRGAVQRRVGELGGAGPRRRACRRARGSAGRRRAGPRSASTCRRSRRRPARRRTPTASVRSRTLSIWIACVPAISHSRVSSLVLALRPAADDDHQVDLARPSPACPPGAGS